MSTPLTAGPAAGDGWNLPLGLEPGEAEPLSEAAVRRWIWIFLALGVAARVLRYLLDFPLWVDESFLAASFWDRGYGGLTQSLEYYQVCPILFLWAELTAVKLFGFSEYALRLFPLVLGLASLGLFRHLAGRLLRGSALLLAVAIFAVAYPCIRYSAEAKQYGAEVFVSLVWIILAVEWRRRPEKVAWLWWLALSAPLGVGLSYTAIFIGGGISAFLAWSMVRVGSRRAWAAWAAFSGLLLASFGLLFWISAGNQAHRSLEFLTDYWHEGFFPLGQPLQLPLWLLMNHIGEMLAYPVGAGRGGSLLTAICCAVGLVQLGRRRQFTFLVLCLTPLLLLLAASAIHRYPYGQMTKFQFFLAPLFCSLAGLGGATLLRRRGGPVPRRSLLPVSLVALLAIGGGTILRDFWMPAKAPSDQRVRDFARWFWFNMPQQGEVVCLKSDLHRTLSPKGFEYGFSSMFLCNQYIYSQRHARHEAPHWERISAEHPLLCLDYWSSDRPIDEAAKETWLAEMQRDYEFVGCESYPFLFYDKRDRTLVSSDHLDVYRFIPKTLPAQALVPRGELHR